MESLFVALGCVVIEPTNPPTAVFRLKEYARLIVGKPWSVPCYSWSPPVIVPCYSILKISILKISVSFWELWQQSNKPDSNPNRNFS